MEFSHIAVLLLAASAAGILSVVFKQPLVIGYLFAGFALSKFHLIPDTPDLESMGKIGITLLLFLLGLEMNLKEISQVGRVAISTALGQIGITFVLGFLLCLILGFNTLTASYLALGLTFSSTIIIVKLLSEKKDLRSLYGRISIGFLLVQDLVAILILMFLSSFATGNVSGNGYVGVFGKAAILFFGIWFLTKKVLPKLVDQVISKSNELTFIFSIAWALGVATFASGVLGFSFEIGGFLAGVSLSTTAEHFQIAGKAKSLRDFFLTIFFLLLGARMGLSGEVVEILPYALVLSLFVLLVNPVVVMAIMGALGYKKRTSFMSGLTTSQVSEFSLIIMALGASLGFVQSVHVSLVTLVGVITMSISTYMILRASRLFKKLEPFLGIFERKVTRESAFLEKTLLKNHIVLVGCDRTGGTIFTYLQKKYADRFVVVDFNPLVFRKLTNKNAPIIFGDIEDPEIIEAANLGEAKLVISTTSDMESNLAILDYLKIIRAKTLSVFTAQTKEDGLKLYASRASYVMVPEVFAGEFIKNLLKNVYEDSDKITVSGKLQFDRLIFSSAS